ncbi:MAG: YchJ family metal-binding protein [Pseudohongiella sp.]|uniref:YchJ family protein n=1 Tax=Pseudohongiella sp. TaxID=1979412 RepID=UPI0034A06D85
MIKPHAKCPCGSNKRLPACCGAFHAGTATPRTAKQLMRSRYSAYALGGLGDYLLQTWHPTTRPAVSAADMGAADTGWVQLDIVDSHQQGNSAMVEFKAYWRDVDGQTQLHHEKSRFVRQDGRWFYVDAELIDA